MQRDLLRKEFKIDLRILGIASSKKMLRKESGIDLDNWKGEFEAKVCETLGQGKEGIFILSTCIHGGWGSRGIEGDAILPFLPSSIPPRTP